MGRKAGRARGGGGAVAEGSAGGNGSRRVRRSLASLARPYPEPRSPPPPLSPSPSSTPRQERRVLARGSSRRREPLRFSGCSFWAHRRGDGAKGPRPPTSTRAARKGAETRRPAGASRPPGWVAVLWLGPDGLRVRGRGPGVTSGVAGPRGRGSWGGSCPPLPPAATGWGAGPLDPREGRVLFGATSAGPHGAPPRHRASPLRVWGRWRWVPFPLDNSPIRPTKDKVPVGYRGGREKPWTIKVRAQ